MSTNLGIVEKFYAAFGNNEWTTVNALFAPACNTVTPGGTYTVAEHEQMGRAFKTALPNAKMYVRHAVESGEWVVVEGNFRGKHEKDLVGPGGTIPAQGKDLDMPYADFFRIRDGKIIEHRVYWDQVSMLAQLGAMPGK